MLGRLHYRKPMSSQVSQNAVATHTQTHALTHFCSFHNNYLMVFTQSVKTIRYHHHLCVFEIKQNPATHLKNSVLIPTLEVAFRRSYL